MSVARILPYFLLAFLVGVFLSSRFFVFTWILWLTALFAAACLCAYLLRQSEVFLFAALISLGLLLGIWRFDSWRDIPRDAHLEESVGTQMDLKGIIVDEPDIREGNTHLTVALTNAEGERVKDTALVFVARYPEYHYGDEVEFSGKLEHPKAFTEADGRVFDYPAYLATKGIHYKMRYPHVEKIGASNGNVLVATLFTIKHTFIHAIEAVLPEPHSSLLSGLLLGGKQSLGEEWLSRFRTAGIIHIIVLSGYNMTVVSEWLVVIFRSLGFFGSLFAGSLGIVLFAIMTGGGATVMRAAVMSLLVLLARATGRTYEMGRALLIAAALMVALNPSILVFDPSFQLSFLASLGLVYIAPVITPRIKLFKSSPVWHEILISTLATQIAVLPILLYQTGMLSLVALPVNLLVLPIIPLAMLTGFAAGVISLIFPFAPWLGFICALPTRILLSWILNVAHLASAIPYASVALTLSSSEVIIMYVLLVCVIWKNLRK